jgi:glycosyltransferase involved in cell wall biosynthesis
MAKMSLSIIIPVCSDRRVFDCIRSIDVDAEVIVVLNGNYDPFIEKNLKKYNVKVLKMDGNFSFSKFYNFGIKNSNGSRIFFLDSDSEIAKGSLKQLYEKTKEYPIVKGDVRFTYNSFWSKIIAKAREFTTRDVPDFYIPGPMFTRKVFDKAGYFNEYISWTSPTELFIRIEEAKIKKCRVPIDVIIHPPLNFKEDLESGFGYGLGRGERYVSSKIKNLPPFFKECKWHLIDGSRKKGFLVGTYLLFWYFIFTLGFIKAKIKYYLFERI